MDAKTLLTLLPVLLALPTYGCGKKDSAPTTESSSAAPAAPKIVALNGAGATFPYPLYSKWMSAYNGLRPEIRINYQSIGSGGGIRQIMARTVDFGATDSPMTEDEQKKSPAKLVHIPTTLGSVVITYNLDGVSQPIQLASDVVADIFLGKIKRWNDTRIASANSAIKLPAKDIAVIYRSDGSGTTGVFTDYLVKVSPEFKEKVGQGKSVKWPVGLGAKGNEGVTGQVKTAPNSISYVEFAYAEQNKLPIAKIKNKSGNFIAPSIAASTAAAAGVELPESLYASITDSAGPDAYPISSYTYLLVYEDLVDPVKGPAIAEFIWWAAHDGQKQCEPLGYAPLPVKVVAQVEARLKSLTVGGKKALDGR